MPRVGYRQLDSATFDSVLTGKQGTIAYLNVTTGPQIRFTAFEKVRPFISILMNMQVASPPTDGVTYLDLGAGTGLGVDYQVHERISVGVDYRYYWFGVADQEDEDYGVGGVYLGFNF